MSFTKIAKEAETEAKPVKRRFEQRRDSVYRSANTLLGTFWTSSDIPIFTFGYV